MHVHTIRIDTRLSIVLSLLKNRRNIHFSEIKSCLITRKNKNDLPQETFWELVLLYNIIMSHRHRWVLHTCFNGDVAIVVSLEVSGSLAVISRRSTPSARRRQWEEPDPPKKLISFLSIVLPPPCRTLMSSLLLGSLGWVAPFVDHFLILTCEAWRSVAARDK